MAKRQKTGFDKYFEQRMRSPAFADEYQTARAEIDAIDTLIRALDAAREQAGLTKADLARQTDTKPEAVRRLMTASGGNPTMATVLKI